MELFTQERSMHMEKQIKFNDHDKELILKINQYQKEHEIKSFIETVRQLCRIGLNKSVNLKIEIE